MVTKIKICGLTNLDDAQAALDAGADLLGFIFYDRSPRSVSVEKTKQIILSLKTGAKPVLKVGVFVNEEPQNIASIMDDIGLDLAQLHGDETPHVLAHPALSDRSYKALRPQNADEANQLVEQYTKSRTPHTNELLPAFLIDAYHPQLRGGSGTNADWQMVKPFARTYPLLLAGGLNPKNIQQAIHAVRPWGVDTASGIESSAGKKDHQKVIDFILAIKQNDKEEV